MLIPSTGSIWMATFRDMRPRGDLARRPAGGCLQVAIKGFGRQDLGSQGGHSATLAPKHTCQAPILLSNQAGTRCFVAGECVLLGPTRGLPMKLLFASTAVGVLALAGSAFAQDLDQPNYVELGLGSGVWGTTHANSIAHTSTPTAFSGDADNHAGPYVAFAAGHKFGIVAAEAEVMHLENGLATDDWGAAAMKGGVSVTGILANVVVEPWAASNISPYIGA